MNDLQGTQGNNGLHCLTPAPTLESTVATQSNETIILVGNPNVGKSVIFSHLTGHYVEVSNYPGTTVEVTRGKTQFNGTSIPIIDTPGINSLLPRSLDEQVTRDILFEEQPRAVIQVADAKNLRRTLLLTVQLIEMGIPMVLVLNMQDEALARGINIETDELSRRLGVQVLGTVAVRKKGLDQLPEAIKAAEKSHFHVAYDAIIENAISQIEALFPNGTSGLRAKAVMALASHEPPENLPPDSISTLNHIRAELSAHYRQPLVYVINQQRLRCVNCIVNVVYRKSSNTERSIADRFGDLAIHPFWGWFILLAVLYGMYQFVGVLGAGTMVDFVESTVFGEWILPTVTSIVETIIPIQVVRDFFVGEYGLFTMALSYGIAIVLPIVTTFFLAFSLLEDSGYLARLAVMANRPFKAMGLNGKAVLPMVLGLGCDTMATMTTRIMETRKERLQVMLLLALGVPCSAQLGAILGMVSFISLTGMLVWAGVVIGILLIVGYLASKIIPGETSDFIVELPPIRTPRPGSIIIKTLARLEWYMKEVLPLFVLGTTLLFVLDGIGGLTFLERLASPVVGGLLGLPEETTGAFLIGFLRRDYGAAGLFALARDGALTNIQVVVSLVVITLFVPCIANFLMIIKEFGWKTATAVMTFIVPFAFLVGGMLNVVTNMIGIKF